MPNIMLISRERLQIDDRETHVFAISLLTALRVRIAQVAADADAHSLMPGGVTERVHAAHLLLARILTGPGGLLAVFVVGAVVVASAFDHTDWKREPRRELNGTIVGKQLSVNVQ